MDKIILTDENNNEVEFNLIDTFGVDDVELHEHWRTADDGDIDAGELFQRLKPG